MAQLKAGTTIGGRNIVQELDSHKNDNTAHQGVPTGAILMWSGSADNIPEGWGLCDGSTYQRVDGTGTITAPDLRDRFIVGAGNEYDVGDTGGEKEVTLSTSQIPSHRHSSGTLSTSSDGDHSHSASSASAGSHSHGSGTLKTDTTGEHSHTYIGSGSTAQLDTGTDNWADRDTATKSTGFSGSHSHSITGSTASSGSHSHKITIDTAGSHSHTISGYTGYIGSGDSHENRPPYYALCFIMKL